MSVFCKPDSKWARENVVVENPVFPERRNEIKDALAPYVFKMMT